MMGAGSAVSGVVGCTESMASGSAVSDDAAITELTLARNASLPAAVPVAALPLLLPLPLPFPFPFPFPSVAATAGPPAESPPLHAASVAAAAISNSKVFMLFSST
jgi:hypothetical protein